MVSFKEFLNDEETVFIDPEEFAESILIEGKPVNVVMDDDSLEKMKLKSGGEGLVDSELLFHVKKSDLDFEPFPEQGLLVDETHYRIQDVKSDGGILSITLGATRA